MPVTLNNTNITINDGTNNFVLETVKTHVPEVDIDIDIVPVITYPDTTTRNLQLAAETATGVNGWRIVRFLPDGLVSAFSSTDNLVGTDVYGDSTDFTTEWSIEFQSGGYDQYLFVGGSFVDWLILNKTEFIPLDGSYNEVINAVKSSVNPNPHTVKAGTGTSGDRPLIALTEWGDGKHLYQESSSGTLQHGSGTYAQRPYYIFVRSSTDTISSSIIPAMPFYETQTLPADSTNLVLWYKLDGNYDDSSGNGNTLMPQGTPNNGLTFNTLSDNIFAYSQWAYSTQTGNQAWATSPYIYKDVPITIAFWFRKTGTASNMTIMSYGNFPTGAIQFDINGTTLNINTALPSHWTTTPSYTGINNNVWYHCAYVLTNENPVKTYLYIDGIQRSTGTGSANSTLMTAVRMTIANSGDGSRGFEGDIGDFRFYDKALSAYEIDILANNKIENPDYKILTFEYNNEHIHTEGMAENATGVYGWSHVKHLNKNATQWYPDNTEEGRDFFTVVDQVFDSHGSFTKPFPEHFDELLFTRSDGNGNVDRFVHCLKTDLETIIAHTNWTANITSIQTHSGPLSLFYGFGRLSSYVNRAPMILSRNSFTNQGDYSVYEEHYQTTSANEGGNWEPPVANKQYDVYARMSIPVQTVYTVNFQAESECDILIVGGGGGGGVYNGGGGGGGGVMYATNLSLNGEYIVKVGKGGDVAATNTQSLLSENGFSSIFGKSGDLLEVFGGGRGGNSNGAIVTTNKNGADGGSGGGGSNNNGIGGYPIQPNYSTEITSANSSYYGGTGGTSGGDTNGGGGGAGNITPNRKNGADGIQINIDGNNYYWGGGGGGGDWNNLGGSGGKGGGGGAGGTSGNGGSGGTGGISVGSDGTGSGGANAQTGVGGDGGSGTGGGGGANAAFNGSVASGNGGSGIVMIRYKTKYIRQHPAYDAQWTYNSTNPNVHHYGNVGIGTLASETNKLTVKGDINVIGDIYENNNKIAYGWDVSGNSVYNQYGNVGIGTNDPRYALHTTGVIYAGQGGITENTSTAWTVTSDNRIKENIEKASYDICSENIKNINLYRFNYNTKYVKTTDKNQLGFIAQDVRKYFPKAVKNKTTRFDNDVVPNLLSVDVTQLNYTMYGAVKHIGQDIDAIKEKLGITEVPNDVKNQPYFTEVIPFNDPDAELPTVNEEPATN